jgi:drug/metabolite transporter (DMT)-like permease
MTEIVVAIIGAVGVVAAAIVPPLLQRRPSPPEAITNPPVWSAWFFGLWTCLFFGLAWIRALMSGTNSNGFEAYVTVLPFIEMMLLGSIAGVLFAYIMQRGGMTYASVASYTAAFFGLVLLVHVFLSADQTRTRADDIVILKASGGYTALIFLLAVLHGSALIAFTRTAMRRLRRP